MCSIKVYTSQLLCGAFDGLMATVCDEASVGLHIGNLNPQSFMHFFWLSTWFMQYIRYQEEARANRCYFDQPCRLSASSCPASSNLFVMET
jgi:hypothetical protein